MKIKICYLILCHKYTENLKELVNYLIEKNNEVIIHVDKKTDLNEFKEINNKVIFIQERINVNWGHISQVEAMIKLLENGIKTKSEYYCLISGDTLIVKSDFEIKRTLIENKGKIFMSFSKKRKDTIKRIKFNYKKSYFFRKERNLLERLLIKIRIKFNLLEKNKLYNNLEVYKGSQWFILDFETIEYILKKINLMNMFKNSYCPDEIFFHTLIMNSSLKEKIFKRNEKDEKEMNLFYIDWSKKNTPKILSKNDFYKISNTDCLFARKFDEYTLFSDVKNYFKIK